MFQAKRSPFLAMLGFALIASMVGFALIASAVGCSSLAPTAIELSLVAAPSQQSGSDALVIRSVDAKIEGIWHPLARAEVAVDLPRGIAPASRRLMAIQPPGGRLRAMRLEIAEPGEGHKSHFIEALCDEPLPACGAGVLVLQLDRAQALLHGTGGAVLRLVSMGAMAGVCGELPSENGDTPLAPTTPDLGGTAPLDLSMDPACANVVCPPGNQCRAGLCVPIDPCMNVVCPPGLQCVAGQCEIPVDMATPPDMSHAPAPDMSHAPDMSEHDCGGEGHDHRTCGHDHGCNLGHHCGHDHHCAHSCGSGQSCPR